MPWSSIGSILGPVGPIGPAGVPAYGYALAGFTVPASGSSVVVTLNDASWAIVGENVWVAGAAVQDGVSR